MCFSATASFMAAGMTGIIGVMALRRTRSAAEVPLACVPLFFSAQQATEGALWLALSDDTLQGLTVPLTQLFLVFALVVWPIYAPLTALALEPPSLRRNIMKVCFLIGVSVSAFFLVQMWTAPHVAVISGHHILYRTDVASPILAGGIYLAATTLALLLSTQRIVAILGAITFVGSLAAHFFYYEVFVSVWCFFAAASSLVILAHFEARAHIMRRGLART
jgi:hypothetical protein